MYRLKRIAGANLFGYAVIYTAQVLFSRFYADLLHPQEVWDVFNYITGVGILIAITVALVHRRESADAADPARRITVQVGVYGAIALAILFFPLWFSLLMGDAQSDAQNVGWILISVLNPLVLGNAGSRLWSTPPDPGSSAGRHLAPT